MTSQVHHSSQKGFSMIEMLVALLIFSIGLLGIASLQTRGQQFNHAAYLRTQATFLAYDIMDRMRANADTVDGNGNADDGGYELDRASCPTSLSNACDGSSNCSPDALATYDIEVWCKSIQNTLPAGDAEIEWKNGNQYDVTIYWTEDRSEDGKPKRLEWQIVL